MKNIFTIGLILILGIFFAPIQAQMQYKFIYTGSPAELSLNLTDSAGFSYSAGTFISSNFSYFDKAVNGPVPSGGYGNSYFVMKTMSNGKPVWLHSIRSNTDSTYINFASSCINNKGEMVFAFTARYGQSITIDAISLPLEKPYDNWYIAKISKTGFLMWLKPVYFDGVSAYGSIKDMAMDEDGNVYLAGDFTGDMARFDNRAVVGAVTDAQLFLAAYNSKGEALWASTNKYIPDQDNGNINLSSMCLSPEGNLLLCGNTDGYKHFLFNTDTLFQSGTSDGFLAQYSASGIAQWAIHFRGNYADAVNEIVCDNGGNISVLGYSSSEGMLVGEQSFSTSGPGSYDAFVASFNSQKAFRWLRSIETQYNESIPQHRKNNQKLGADSEGNIYFIDEFTASIALDQEVNRGTNGSSDLVMASFNPESGNTRWSFSAGGIASDQFSISNIGSDGSILFGGYYYDPFVIGDTYLGTSNNYNNYYLSRLSNEGIPEFSQAIQGNNSDYIYLNDISQDPFGNVMVAGTFYGANNEIDGISVSNEFNQGIYLGRYTHYASIAGMVTDEDGVPAAGGYVVAYGNTQNSRSPIIDSIPIQADGSFESTDIPFGSYILMAKATDNAGTAYLPAYYPSPIHWDYCERILINEPIRYAPKNIVVSSYIPLTGEGGFQGLVTEADETDLFKAVNAKPTKGGRASLASTKTTKSTDYEIIEVTSTDENGYFSFNNVPDGTYTIFIEIAGIPVEQLYDLEITGNQFISNVDYFVGEETITPTNPEIPMITGTRVTVESLSKVYPVPSNEGVWVETNDNLLIQSVMVTDLQGRTMLTLKPEQTSIYIDELPAGVYFARVRTQQSSETIRFIITPSGK